MKQTAIEWLKKELEKYGDPGYCKIEWEIFDELIEYAKEMEKEQIIDTSSEAYYNETFKSE